MSVATISARAKWLSLLIAALFVVGSAPAHAAPPLDVRLGNWIENSTTAPDGSVLVSNLTGNRVQRIDRATGAVTTFAKVDNPGGLAVRGNTLYVAVGNNPLSVFTKAGRIVAINLSTGQQRVLSSGWGEVNGLDVLPGGDIVFTVTLGHGSGLQRLDPNTGQVRRLSGPALAANGLAVGPDGQVYVGSTLTATITKVDPDTGSTSLAAGFSVLLDDFGFLPDGRIVAATTLGQVDVIDLKAGTNRPISGGNLGATSAKASGGEVIVTTVLGRVFSLPTPS